MASLDCSWTTTLELCPAWWLPWSFLCALEKVPLEIQVKTNNLLCNCLQLSNLLVEMGNVLLDDVGQLLDLHWLVVEDGFPLSQQCQLLQFCVG